MELPFAVESSTSHNTAVATNSTATAGAASMSSSLYHPSSNASSLVTASSSQGSLGKSNNENILYASSNNNLHHHHNHQRNNTHNNSNHHNQSNSNNNNNNTMLSDVAFPFHSNNHLLQHPQSVVRSTNTTDTTTAAPSAAPAATPAAAATAIFDTETIDFTYVTVCEEDADDVVDIIMDTSGSGDASPTDNMQQQHQRDNPQGDVLTVLLSGTAATTLQGDFAVVNHCEEGNIAAHQAIEFKKEGNLNEALDAHVRAAKLFKDAGVAVRESNASLSNSLLLLSQNQAKAALVLKRILRQRPVDLQRTTSSNGGSGGGNDGSGGGGGNLSSSMSQKERLRATLRGALGQKKEADMSDSVFLGRASSGPSKHSATTTDRNKAVSSSDSKTKAESNNPVDDMMELERELREMDMALELGNSIASLDARTINRMKNTNIDGSFMMVAPGQSYMSSSALWASGMANPRPAATVSSGGTAGARARANHVQNVLQASSAGVPAIISHPPPPPSNHHQSQHHQHHNPTNTSSTTASHSKPPSGLESSWWGNASTTSQVLANSVISLSSRAGSSGSGGGHHDALSHTASQPTNTKQLMRLLDSLKTLGDENATLLREVEEAEAARLEAKAAKEQMQRFKAEYGQRFAALKAALEKFRKGYPESNNNNNNNRSPNPVTTSDFFRTASTSEQLQRQEQLIRKLTEDLKKEKNESRKKDAALRKYESFYREVKARSAQKAAQRQQALQQSPPPRHLPIPPSQR